MYLILLILGLGIGAVFLVVLLIGDWKEARRERQRQALPEQQAGQPPEDSWPPPPNVPAPPLVSGVPAAPVNPLTTRAANRKMVRNFFLIRNYAIALVVFAYILYSCFPRFGFGWVLAATVGAALAIRCVLILRKRDSSTNR